MIGATTLTFACNCKEAIAELPLDIISYDDLMNDNPETLSTLRKALYENGIVGVRGIPGYKEAAENYIAAIRQFGALPEAVKEKYAPPNPTSPVGYQNAKEKFKRPDGNWVVEDHKISYYAFVPETPVNIWPVEVDLKTPFGILGSQMATMGITVMEKVGLIGGNTGIVSDNLPMLGRILHYKKTGDSKKDNPYWCGAHFDHGIFTALIPAYYFVSGEEVPEPYEAGLFIKMKDGVFRKVFANDPDVMMFQVGEFGQVIANDTIMATEHRVEKASGNIERYTMALFFDIPWDTVVYSTSELTSDARYGGGKGDPCLYSRWREESFKRYLIKDEDK